MDMDPYIGVEAYTIEIPLDRLKGMSIEKLKDQHAKVTLTVDDAVDQLSKLVEYRESIRRLIREKTENAADR